MRIWKTSCTSHDMTLQHARIVPATSGGRGSRDPRAPPHRRPRATSVRPRRRCVCPCQPGPLESPLPRTARQRPGAHSARDLPPPHCTGGATPSACPPVLPEAVLRRSFSVDDGSWRDRRPTRPSAAAGARTVRPRVRLPQPGCGPRTPAPPRRPPAGGSSAPPSPGTTTGSPCAPCAAGEPALRPMLAAESGGLRIAGDRLVDTLDPFGRVQPRGRAARPVAELPRATATQSARRIGAEPRTISASGASSRLRGSSTPFRPSR